MQQILGSVGDKGPSHGMVVCLSYILHCRIKHPLLSVEAVACVGLTTRRPGDFIRFCARDRMTGRRARLANAIEHRTCLMLFRLSWRTPSSHNSASTQLFGSLAMLAPAEIQCQRIKETGARWLVPSRAVVPFRRSNKVGFRLRYPAASWKAFSKHSSFQCGVFAETQ